MKKLVVIGSNAFSGQDFVDLALEQGFPVLGVSRSPEKDSLFLRYKNNPAVANFSFLQADLNADMDKLLTALDNLRPEYIVNFAAQSEVAQSWDHPEHWYQTNVASFAKLVNHLARVDYLEKYLHISSPEVYGSCQGWIRETEPINPSTPYAASKAAADALLHLYQRQFNLPVVIVRATNVYGARQQAHKIIPKAIITFKKGHKLVLDGGGAQIRSFIHIRDVSDGAMRVLLEGVVGEIYHLSPPQSHTLREVIGLVCTTQGVNIEEVIVDGPARPGHDQAYTINCQKAQDQLGWSPKITLVPGITEVLEWVEDNWNVLSSLPVEYQHKP